MTKQRGGTLGPGLPFIPNDPPPPLRPHSAPPSHEDTEGRGEDPRGVQGSAGQARVGDPEQPAIVPSTLAPGMMLTTSTEAFLILRTLGEGGTARAFLAIRVRTAQFSDPGVILPTPSATPGVAVVLPEHSDLLATLEDTAVTCALKVSLTPRGDPAYDAIVERMRLEAQGYGSIDDPRIPKLYSAGDSPIPYIALERFHGPTLRAVLNDHRRSVTGEYRMPWQQAVTLVARIAMGVHVLHTKQIVHRDLKPENVIVDRHAGLDDMPKILDLGIMRFYSPAGIGAYLEDVLPEDRNITRHFGGLPVTPGYGAPEQYDTEASITPAADVYALGVIAYELFTGRIPYDAPYPKILAEMERPLPPIRHPDLSNSASVEVDRILARAIAYDAKVRIPTALEFVRAMQSVVTLSVDRARPVGVGVSPAPSTRTTPMTRRTPVTSALRRPPSRARPIILAIALLLVVGFAVFFSAQEDTTTAARIPLAHDAGVTAAGSPAPPTLSPASPKRPPVHRTVVPKRRNERTR